MNTSVEEQLDILLRGVIETVPTDEFKKKIENSVKTNKPLRIKLGVDPTAPDVHLGHTVVMRKLAQFQKLGHTVILIVGDYTATVGDPSGKNKTRPRLSHEEVLEHATTYQEQFFKIVDRDKTEIVMNGDWFSKMTFAELTKLMSRMTVAQMLEREDFSNRYKSGSPISLHEFLYPLMQGYDSLMIEADVEIGGTDQKFNVLRGREIQVAEGQEPQIGLFMPILLGTDGKEKMSKSLGNYVGVNEAADVMYHKVYTIPDSQIQSWFELLTDKPLVEIEKMVEEIAAGNLNPNQVKEELALDIVSQYHGKEAAEVAKAKEKEVHSGQAIPSDAPVINLEASEVGILSLAVQCGAFQSNGEARRMVQNGGLKLDGEKQSDPRAQIALESGREYILQAGKRKFFRIQVS
jgi:tyrosyl-tRNA synthetase